MKQKIAFIGAVGVPNVYGGFESFLESTAPLIAEHFEKVYVTCDRFRYPERERFWCGLHRIFIPLPANGGWSVAHDLFAFFAVFWRVDSVVVLGISGGLFFPLFRALCAIMQVRLIVNVDGIEWRRRKFSWAKRAFLYLSDRIAQIAAHRVIVDNEALRPYLSPVIRGAAIYIPYPGDHARTSISRVAGNELFCLTICRIEPENNCHLLLEAFARSGQGRYIFVGNWQGSKYGRRLRTQFESHPGLDLRDPTYDREQLAQLRSRCRLYLHGHSVGGTNPSLVEMLFYDCPILAFDCEFNRATAGDGVEYFLNQRELDLAIFSLTKGGSGKSVWAKRRERLRETRYTRATICSEYVAAIGKH